MEEPKKKSPFALLVAALSVIASVILVLLYLGA
jgi:hypothetical protein